LLAFNERKSGETGASSNLLEKIFSSSTSSSKEKDRAYFKVNKRCSCTNRNMFNW